MDHILLSEAIITLSSQTVGLVLQGFMTQLLQVLMDSFPTYPQASGNGNAIHGFNQKGGQQPAISHNAHCKDP